VAAPAGGAAQQSWTGAPRRRMGWVAGRHGAHARTGEALFEDGRAAQTAQKPADLRPQRVPQPHLLGDRNKKQRSKERSATRKTAEARGIQSRSGVITHLRRTRRDLAALGTMVVTSKTARTEHK